MLHMIMRWWNKCILTQILQGGDTDGSDEEISKKGKFTLKEKGVVEKAAIIQNLKNQYVCDYEGHIYCFIYPDGFHFELSEMHLAAWTSSIASIIGVCCSL
jgi:hypothetical protein